ncbi:hypothetical protein F7725_024591 [Dissostichus mawsoni]|uniref:C2 domain-containing protein n=1 Tax=Dissostichus mawsoni TaxID=36200 RepID=A0A7J5X9W0_DISMA|nr:hypothetical protein F7725_024591 [Dissostichus mawsoni]
MCVQRLERCVGIVQALTNGLSERESNDALTANYCKHYNKYYKHYNLYYKHYNLYCKHYNKYYKHYNLYCKHYNKYYKHYNLYYKHYNLYCKHYNKYCKHYNKYCKHYNKYYKHYNLYYKHYNLYCKHYNKYCKHYNLYCKHYNKYCKHYNKYYKHYNLYYKHYNLYCKHYNKYCKHYNKYCKHYNLYYKHYNLYCKHYNKYYKHYNLYCKHYNKYCKHYNKYCKHYNLYYKHYNLYCKHYNKYYKHYNKYCKHYNLYYKHYNLYCKHYNKVILSWFSSGFLSQGSPLFFSLEYLRTECLTQGHTSGSPLFFSLEYLRTECLTQGHTSCSVLFQVKLWYDKVGHQLIVTVLGAKELPVRADSRPRNPFVKIYFLPDRRPSPSLSPPPSVIGATAGRRQSESLWILDGTRRAPRISELEEDGIGVVSDYRLSGRDFHSSTQSVPEQVMMASNQSARSDLGEPSRRISQFESDRNAVRQPQRTPAAHQEEKKKKVIRLPVQRSVETGLAVEFKGRFTRQPSRDPDADDPKPGATSAPPSWPGGRRWPRPPWIGMVYRKERLDVEVIRARGLVGKQGTKNNTPAPYVKVYLMDNGKCVMKRRTRLARKSPDPLYQQQLQFEEMGHQLIVTVLGAKELPVRADSRPRRNPFVKIYFLPDRSDRSYRRTKTVRKSLDPRWNQTFMFSSVQNRDLRERNLELTAWDQGGEELLLGEKKRSGIGAKMMGLVGLGKKQNSQINPEEEEKKKKVIRLPVQRSVETGLAVEFKGRFTRQPSRDPDADDPKPGATSARPAGREADAGHAPMGALIGRWWSGDIQIGMVYRKERLDVEVIRARGLVGKQGTKNNTPAPYVKVYLMDNGKCVMKRRTRLARKSPDPLYQQQLQFEENPIGRPGPVQHGDWLVQTVPRHLIGRPRPGPADQ